MTKSVPRRKVPTIRIGRRDRTAATPASGRPYTGFESTSISAVSGRFSASAAARLTTSGRKTGWSGLNARTRIFRARPEAGSLQIEARASM